MWRCGLPQFERISFRVMQAGEPAVGVGLGVDLDLDLCGSKLGYHFVEVPDAKVHHPDFAGVAEVAARLCEGGEDGERTEYLVYRSDR